jgi:hypothetical protein
MTNPSTLKRYRYPQRHERPRAGLSRALSGAPLGTSGKTQSGQSAVELFESAVLSAGEPAWPSANGVATAEPRASVTRSPVAWSTCDGQLSWAAKVLKTGDGADL